MQPQTQNVLKGIGCLLFAVTVWGGWIVASRFAVKGTLSPYDVTALRFLTAGLVMLPLVIKKGLRVGPWGLKSALLLSCLMGAPYTFIMLSGMRFSSASHASIITNGTMLMVMTLGGIMLLKEATTRGRVAGALCSACGIIYMMVVKGGGYHDPKEWIGHIFFAISGAMWACYGLLMRAWRLDAWHATAVVVVISMLLYMPLYLLFCHSNIGVHNWQEVMFQAFYQGFLTGVVAFIAFNTGVHILGASRAGMVVPLVPVVATLLAIPVLHETPSTHEWTAIALILFGVMLSSDVLQHSTRLMRLK